MEQKQQQQRQGGEPPVGRGNIADFLPVGSYACPIKGEAKAAYDDYIRIKMPRDIPEEGKGKVVSAPMKEVYPEDRLLPGAYVCPIKGEAKRAYGDYRRIGVPGTFP